MQQHRFYRNLRVYFLSASSSEQEQLSRFSKAIGQFFEEPLLETRGFASWEESFQ